MGQTHSSETFMILGIGDEGTKHDTGGGGGAQFSIDKARILLLNAYRHAFLSGDDCNLYETTELKCLSHVHIYKREEEENLKHSSHHQRTKCLCGESGGGGGEVTIPNVSFLHELGLLRMFFRVCPGDEILLSKSNFSSSTIKELSLRNTGLPWEKISIIGKLPNLHALTLIHNAFKGNVWETRDGEFRKLKYLMVGSCELKLWMVSYRGHFPSLECLVIRDGPTSLGEIPSELGYIPTLQRIEAVSCSETSILALSAIQIEDEQRKYGNNNLQVIIVNDYHEKGEIRKDQIKLYHLQDAFNKCISIEDCLEEYYKAGGSEGFLKKLATTDQEKETPTPSDDPLLLCSPRTFSPFLCYVRQFCPNLEKNGLSYTVNDLCCAARSYLRRKLLLPGYRTYYDEISKAGREFTELLVSSFIPQVLEFFQVPKLQQNNHKENETLAAFMNFLVQMLFSLERTALAEEKQYALLRKELSFILSILGDTPFQPTHPQLVEQTNSLLAEFEMLANEAGCFVCSCVLPIHTIKVSMFYAETTVLIEKAQLLSSKIEEHCSAFSELPMVIVSRSPSVDSFFIVDSLIDDVQSVMANRQLGSFTFDDAVMDQIERLNGELKHSQRFVKDISKATKESLIQIRDLAYEGEYLLSSCVSGNLPIWYLNLRLPSIVQKIKVVNDALQQNKEMRDTEARKRSDGEVLSFRTLGNPTIIDDNYFVDFNEDITKKILKDLIGKPKTPRETILIFGMPGLGKTTAATKLYNCKAASAHFDRRAWSVVSQTYSVRTLFIQILMDLGCDQQDVESISGKKVPELGVLIHKTLKQRRYLIVLDDVWEADVWDALQIYFPDDRNGSRVVITSRNKYVAPTGSIFHKLPFLSDDQCWDLIQKKVFRKDPCPPNLLSIGKTIAKRCSGVPLAVANMAGLLANLEIEISVWERVEKELDKLLLDDQSDYRKIMELSYEHLPHNIKPCFLYFASFPEDAEISKKELTWFWIAEGFVQKDKTKSLEEIAEAYLLDLINRSLVITANMSYDGGLKTCRIHDLLHDICVTKANEENFFKFTNMFSIYETHRRISVPYSSGTTWMPFGLHCRSIRDCQTHHLPNFRTMALLKIFKTGGPSSLNERALDLPVQLRYLYTADLHVGMVTNLFNLEFIRVRSYHKVSVPAVVLTMVKLRHLIVTPDAEFEEHCNISETTKLRSLSRVCIYRKADEEILRYSPRLQTLKCVCGGGTTFPDIGVLTELESLNMHFETGLSDEILSSKIYFPSSIKKLTLRGSLLPWEKMSIIGKLPNLHVLKLEENAFKGEEWVTNDEEFHELRFLKITNGLLKQWISESDHFPSLEQLLLFDCDNLEEIPSDLACSATLQRVEVRGCSESVRLSAIQIQEEQREYGNDIECHLFNQFNYI